MVATYVPSPTGAADYVAFAQRWAASGVNLMTADASGDLAGVNGVQQYTRPARLPDQAARTASGWQVVARKLELAGEVTHVVCLDTCTTFAEPLDTAWWAARGQQVQNNPTVRQKVPTLTGVAELCPLALLV